MLETAGQKRALVDTESNEVLTPYDQKLWDILMQGSEAHDGSIVKMVISLAGERTRIGYRSGWGEVMMEQKGTVELEDAWIMPMSRLQEELGMAALYRSDGSAVLIWPDNNVILLHTDDGLQYMGWTDFMILRDELIASHLKGRPKYKGPIGDLGCTGNLPPGLPMKDGMVAATADAADSCDDGTVTVSRKRTYQYQKVDLVMQTDLRSHQSPSP